MTVTDRVKAAGSATAGVSKTVGNAAQAAGEVVAEGAKTVRDRALSTKSAPSGLETTRGKAAAAVGAAGAAAGALAFWKKSQGGAPDVVVDPSVNEPTSVTTVETPEAKAAKEAASTANGDSS